MRKSYPSDISREQFSIISEFLEGARRKTAPRKVDLYEVFCAVLYLLHSACSWRSLPGDFPKRRTVHSYYQIWSQPDEQGVSLLERVLKNQVGAAREALGRKAETTFLIVDAQSVKNTDTAMHKGYDAGKKISGIKRHIAVDTQGFPHAVAVTTADVTDHKGALIALERCKPSLNRVQSLLCDSGYVGEPFAQGVQAILVKTSQCKLPSAVNCILSRSYPSAGSLSVVLLGWRKTGVYGKTASDCSIPACSLFISLSWLCCSKDFEQVLTRYAQ